MPPPPNIPNHPIHPLRNLLRALPPRASIAPNIPFPLLPVFGAESGDFGGCDAFVETVVPFADVFCYLDGGVRADGGGGGGGGGGLPGEVFCAAEVEEFEGEAGAVAGGDVAGW